MSGTTEYGRNNLNQYTSIGEIGPSYDSNGNLISDGSGAYAYDAGNRLITAASASTTAGFAYDPLNRQVCRTINGVTTYFVYDGWNLIAEYSSSGTLRANYIHGARIDEILAKIDSSGTTVYYHHDGLGSTTALTNAAGALLESYHYDAFGRPTIYNGGGSGIPGIAYGNRFMFAGREYLAELNLYDSRNRFYSPELGRFLQTDPLRFGAGDANIYRYVGNRAANAIDPLGLCEDDNPLGFGPPKDFVDDLTKQLMNGGDDPETAIERAQELPLDTTYRDGGEGDPDGIYVTHYGPSKEAGGWDPDGDSGTDKGRGAVDPNTGQYIQIDNNSLAISKDVADKNGLQFRDPVYVNGQYIGNYDDRAPEPGRIDVYDRINAVNQRYWGVCFGVLPLLTTHNVAMSTRAFAVWLCIGAVLPVSAQGLGTTTQRIAAVDSPDEKYSIRVSSNGEHEGRVISVLRHGLELAHYRFEGELVTAYWSPSGKFAAINNHNGHRGWYIWIFSLENGNLIRANDVTRSAEYDRYSDYDGYLPNIPELAKDKILAMYDGYAGDYNFKGYISVAYGWEKGDRLLVFHEFTLAKLEETEHMKIHVYSQFDLQSGHGFTTSIHSVRKVKDTASWKSADVPPEVRKTLNLSTQKSAASG